MTKRKAPAARYGLIIENVRVVRPHGDAVHEADIANGRFARIAPGLDVALAKQVYDGRGRLAFPGVVDAHMRSGIHASLHEDAVTGFGLCNGKPTTTLFFFPGTRKEA